MSLSRCPHCGNPLTSEERKGRTCPGCGKSLAAAPGPEAVAPRESTWEGPSRLAAREPVWVARTEGVGWGTVRAGLALVAVGLVLVFAGLLIQNILDRNYGQKGFLELPAGIQLLHFVVGFAFLAGGITLTAVGLVMSCAAPGGTGAKGWANGVVLCLVVGGIAFLLRVYAPLANDVAASEWWKEIRERRSQITKEELKALAEKDFQRVGELSKKRQKLDAETKPDDPWSPGAVKGLKYTFQGALILAGFFFLWFLWAVARRFGRRGLAVSILYYLLVSTLVGVGAFVLTIVAEKDPDVEKFFSGNWVWAWMGVMGAFCLWSVIHLLLVRRAIAQSLEARS
jgi:hypothetical protein